MIYLELFWTFLQVGLFSIGGGYAAIPLIQSKVVEGAKWISMSEFTDLMTIAEMTPGPIGVNSATFVGIRVAGFGGALAATFGCIFPSLIIVSILAIVYMKYKKLSALQSVLSNLRPAIVALIAAAGISLFLQAGFGSGNISLETAKPISLVLFAGAFFVLRKFKLNPILVMASCGLINLLIGIILGFFK